MKKISKEYCERTKQMLFEVMDEFGVAEDGMDVYVKASSLIRALEKHERKTKSIGNESQDTQGLRLAFLQRER